MKRAVRVGLAVLAGVVLWGALWNVGTLATQRAWPELAEPGAPVTHAGVLAAWLAWSGALSVAAGYLAAAAAGPHARVAVRTLAGVNLAIGVAVEAAYWELMPAWYHVVFLALVVPATLYGGRSRRPAGGAVAAARA